jgi:glutamyl-Q tRNA(Asp) synthetase
MITRFAPSPTGLLHLGHVLAARFAFDAARAEGGRYLVRIEDIDQTRCRPEYRDQILQDLAWLGLDSDGPVIRQSERFPRYAEALDRLHAHDLLYPCFCTRREIQAEIARSPSAPQGPDGPLYPGTCRGVSAAARAAKLASGAPFAWRLDMAAALKRAPGDLKFFDRDKGWIEARPEQFGDVVLARKESPTSYHLAVTVDDAAQEITLVTRGEDLAPAAHLHRLLQALLDLPTPEYRFHPLLTDADGKRLAKRDGAKTIASLREQGYSPQEVTVMASPANADREPAADRPDAPHPGDRGGS